MAKKTEISSGTLFAALIERKRKGGSIRTDDVLVVLEKLSDELKIMGASELLDAAYNACAYYCERDQQRKLETAVRGFSIAKDVRDWSYRPALSNYDAYAVIILLANYMELKEDSQSIENWIRYMGENYKPINPNYKEIEYALHRVEEKVRENRKTALLGLNEVGNIRAKYFRYYNDLGLKAYQQAKTNAAGMEEEAEQKAARILRTAEAAGSRLKEEAAKAARERLMEAGRQEEQRLSDAKERNEKLFHAPRRKRWEERTEVFEREFESLIGGLRDLQDFADRLETIEKEKNTLQVYEQYYDLYTLIAETRQAFADKTEAKEGDWENVLLYMEEFLEMIEENLAEFGIETISSKPESPVNEEIHELTQEEKLPESGKLVVKRSLLSGFRFRGQILQKEKIEAEQK
ncbi:MAG: hypothetical protein K6E30_11150 [Lachnospiraceae bacterium]|nr:hypothetical protein [Lachnospiraceae bacterium]